MKTLICNNTLPWFSSFFEPRLYKPIFMCENPVIEEISETPLAYNFNYFVPGFKKRDINVSIQDRMLTITGSLRKSRSWWNSKVNRTTENHFRKNTCLSSDMDIDRIKAKLNHGVLSIEIPKKDEFVNYRKIPVSGKTEAIVVHDSKTNTPQSIFKDIKQKMKHLFKFSG